MADAYGSNVHAGLEKSVRFREVPLYFRFMIIYDSLSFLMSLWFKTLLLSYWSLSVFIELSIWKNAYISKNVYTIKTESIW